MMAPTLMGFFMKGTLYYWFRLVMFIDIHSHYLFHSSRKDKHMAKDEKVQSAISNWAPRFVSNGVDANDFQRVTESIERWDDWCQKWAECGAMHARMGEQAESEGNYVSAAQHYFHAVISYH